MTMPLRIAIGSVGVGLLVLALKAFAYYLTGSVALYSDALESVVNVASALAALLAVWYAAKPADSNHPYGHHKAEYFAAVLVGVLIVLAALSIVREAWMNYQAPQEITYSAAGLLANGAASVINGIWAYVLLREGRRQRSVALEADGRHLVTDVVSSLGVLLGVGLVLTTGWETLDSVLAGLVAINILWSGWLLVKQSIGGLMDEAAPFDVQDKLRDLISEAGEGALEAHDLRTRAAGNVIFVDFHLVVPGDMTVRDAHDICDRIEELIEERLPSVKSTIHVEPEHKAKHSGIVVL